MLKKLKFYMRQSGVWLLWGEGCTVQRKPFVDVNILGENNNGFNGPLDKLCIDIRFTQKQWPWWLVQGNSQGMKRHLGYGEEPTLGALCCEGG